MKLKRLTNMTDYVLGTYSDMEERLMNIEDILGDEYDLDRLKEAVKLIDKLDGWSEKEAIETKRRAPRLR